jgi:hypothetical protein
MSKTTLPTWATGVLSIAGAVLLASLFVDWVDVKGFEVSGLRIAWEDKHWMFLIPLSGALLLYTAATRSTHARLAAVVAGLVVFGAVVFGLLRGAVRGGADSWLIFGGAGVVLAGMAPERKLLRAIGGAAVLLGFFAPWARASLFDVLTSKQLQVFADQLGIAVRVLWLIPLAAAAAVFSSVVAEPRGKRLALGAAIVVYGSFLYMFGSAANAVLAWGAWGAFIASAIAFAIGVLAPGARKAQPAAA